MCLQPLGIGITFLWPTRAQQGTSLEHLTCARDERGKKSEFSRREIERASVHARDVRLRIQPQAANGRGGLTRRGGTRPAE
jgi:hypothetical protein